MRNVETTGRWSWKLAPNGVASPVILELDKSSLLSDETNNSASPCRVPTTIT